MKTNRSKEGKTPEGWDDQPNMKCQKDQDSRWTKKHGKNYYGCRNRMSIDKEHKLIRRYGVTDASFHDSQVFDDLLDGDNVNRCIWADSAYRSVAREEQLRDQGYNSRIHRKGTKQRALNQREQKTIHRRSKTRARVEHVFGNQRTARGSILVPTKRKVESTVKIGMMNLKQHETICVLAEAATRPVRWPIGRRWVGIALNQKN